MYEDLMLALNMCANNPGCENCPWIGDTECTANLMNAAIVAIQQLQGNSSRKIDFDVDPDEFMKMLGATECRNGTEYIEMFCMGYEDDVFAVDIKNKHDLALLKMYFEKYSGKSFGETIKDDYIGKRVIVNFWDESCNVVGTREEMESKFKSYLDRLFGHKNRSAKIQRAEKCLIDNGIDPDEAQTVLQAIGYILLDEELYEEGTNEKV